MLNNRKTCQSKSQSFAKYQAMLENSDYYTKKLQYKKIDEQKQLTKIMIWGMDFCFSLRVIQPDIEYLFCLQNIFCNIFISHKSDTIKTSFA